MRLILLVLAVAFGIDAYAYSGAYTQATVAEISSKVHQITSDMNTDTNSARPMPPRPLPDKTAG
jgi:hypothetical protein